MTTPPVAHPPETIEGWFALHQIFRCARNGRSSSAVAEAQDRVQKVVATKSERASTGSIPGWSCVARLIGSLDDLMVIHFRESLDEIGEAQRMLTEGEVSGDLMPTYNFLSVTEAGLYHITAELARAAQARRGKVGDEEYRSALQQRITSELEGDHVRRRLYPQRPSEMPYVCFYPMSKRRDSGQNWYTLSLDERSRLMQSHGLTGRRYAGRVQQVITGAIGFDRWEWGVTLFASDPIEFKKLVTDMRFDEVSAKYAEFGEFYVGRIG